VLSRLATLYSIRVLQGTLSPEHASHLRRNRDHKPHDRPLPAAPAHPGKGHARRDLEGYRRV
ncbi:MAG: hypothetical protein AVDCRST_MAG37-2255, partial [uncultured Rubrobacteraceae bacterium]